MPQGLKPEVIEYQQLRFIVGAIGFSFPFVLVIGNRIFDGCWLHPSLSQYYDGSMRNLFVGVLTAIGVFLLSYRGSGDVSWLPGPVSQWRVGRVACTRESALRWLAGPSAILVAFFPVCCYQWEHYTAAFSFFFCLAAYAIAFLNSAVRTGLRWLFGLCAGCIVSSVVAILVCFRLKIDSIVFPESFGVVMFGIAWLAKSELDVTPYLRRIAVDLNLVDLPPAS